MSKYSGTIEQQLAYLKEWAGNTAQSSGENLMNNAAILSTQLSTITAKVDEFGLPLIDQKQKLRLQNDEIIHNELLNQIKAQEQIIEQLNQQVKAILQKQRPLYKKISANLYKLGKKGQKLAHNIASQVRKLYNKVKNKKHLKALQIAKPNQQMAKLLAHKKQINIARLKQLNALDPNQFKARKQPYQHIDVSKIRHGLNALDPNQFKARQPTQKLYPLLPNSTTTSPTIQLKPYPRREFVPKNDQQPIPKFLSTQRFNPSNNENNRHLNPMFRSSLEFPVRKQIILPDSSSTTARKLPTSTNRFRSSIRLLPTNNDTLHTTKRAKGQQNYSRYRRTSISKSGK